MTETMGGSMNSVALRPANPEDRDQVLAWRNARNVRQHMYTNEEIAPETHASWFAAALKDPARRLWIIVVDGRDVGVATLYELNWTNRTASWAFYIGEDGLRGRGVGSATEDLVLRQAFEVENLARLDCEVLETNRHVIALHEKFGFSRQGLIKARVVREGLEIDAVRLTLTRDAWWSRRQAGRTGE